MNDEAFRTRAASSVVLVCVSKPVAALNEWWFQVLSAVTPKTRNWPLSKCVAMLVAGPGPLCVGCDDVCAEQHDGCAASSTGSRSCRSFL